MAMYRYVKKVARPRRPWAISIVLIGLGVGILVWTTWPIVSFELWQQRLFAKTVSPVSDSGKNTVFSPVVLASTDSLDYTNPNIWFPTKPQKKVVLPVNSYKLSIPKLGINGATVIIAGDDLAKSLIHYGGTGLPGEYGNTVIFGHSTLPQFFKGERDYKAIFSTLPTLKIGEEIIIEYDSVTYRYKIYEMTVTEPNDLSPLEQRFDDSYLTLITCVPPGTYWKRLNVKARLIKPL